mmetsp:Transcript_3021/g.6719  ORF Transcript_3021/g.6719 Transcript_3021/m.6719 type:complete len:216 (-) Transcript_3021:1585-2232(-)
MSASGGPASLDKLPRPLSECAGVFTTLAASMVIEGPVVTTRREQPEAGTLAAAADSSEAPPTDAPAEGSEAARSLAAAATISEAPAATVSWRCAHLRPICPETRESIDGRASVLSTWLPPSRSSPKSMPASVKEKAVPRLSEGTVFSMLGNVRGSGDASLALIGSISNSLPTNIAAATAAASSGVVVCRAGAVATVTCARAFATMACCARSVAGA